MIWAGLSQLASFGGAPGSPAITGLGDAAAGVAGPGAPGLERPASGEACLAVVDEPAEQAARATRRRIRPAPAGRNAPPSEGARTGHKRPGRAGERRSVSAVQQPTGRKWLGSTRDTAAALGDTPASVGPGKWCFAGQKMLLPSCGTVARAASPQNTAGRSRVSSSTRPGRWPAFRSALSSRRAGHRAALEGRGQHHVRVGVQTAGCPGLAVRPDVVALLP